MTKRRPILSIEAATERARTLLGDEVASRVTNTPIKRIRKWGDPSEFIARIPLHQAINLDHALLTAPGLPVEDRVPVHLVAMGHALGLEVEWKPIGAGASSVRDVRDATLSLGELVGAMQALALRAGPRLTVDELEELARLRDSLIATVNDVVDQGLRAGLPAVVTRLKVERAG